MPRQEAFDFISNAAPTLTHDVRRGRSGAFTDNMNLPIHRWFRYSAGFSAEWAENIIRSFARKPTRLLDPFAGSGTALIASERMGVASVGWEAHPFVYRIANAKLSWHADPEAFFQRSLSLVQRARSYETGSVRTTSRLLLKCYDSRTLERLEALKEAYLAEFAGKDDFSELVWLCLTSILRECSHAGTAQWQYVLPGKSKARVKEPYSALVEKARCMRDDLIWAGYHLGEKQSRIILTDARFASSEDESTFNLVITSPPYPNNYDYADATRLEMTFWGEVCGWGDLQEAVRRYLVRSCSQHTAAERLDLSRTLADPLLQPIRPELSEVCDRLSIVRETKGGKKTYHTMVAAYFSDLAKIWRNLRSRVERGARVCFVIGDSAPYGVYVPCEEWLGKLALSAGFRTYRFEKLRDRNVKWKNRKHRVPLKEGVLLVEG